MLGPREAHPLRAKLARQTALLGSVGVHPHTERAPLVGPREQLDEQGLLAELRLDRWQLAKEDLARRSVDRDRVTLAHDLVADAHLPLLEIDVERRYPGHARKAETT